jgi:acyl carrier protein
MATLDSLRGVFRHALALPDDFAVDDLQYRGIEKWDSLAHMALVTELEDEYGIMIDTDDVIDMSSFAQARKIIEKYGVQFDG